VAKQVENTSLPIQVNQMSAGEKGLLSLVADIVRRLILANSDMENPLEGNGIVLIDEIDLHLHPKWQRNIVPKLRKIFPNIQFVVTTHSPVVLGAVSKDVFIGKENVRLIHNFKAYIPSSSPQGRTVNDILEEVMQTPKRDEQIETLSREYFRLIQKRKPNIPKIQELQGQLENLLAKDDPLFVKANAILKQRNVLVE
ncbi:MAG: AAA family ATPase, partial [Chitinophagales bacterium]